MQEAILFILKHYNTGGKSFICTTEEGSFAKKQIDDLLNIGSNFANQSGNFNKNSDRKIQNNEISFICKCRIYYLFWWCSKCTRSYERNDDKSKWGF